MAIAAVVFDFDGVLADSEILHLRAYQDVLRPLGIELSRSDYFARYLGFDDEGVFRQLASERGRVLEQTELVELIARKAAVFEVLEGGSDMLFPGAAACIRRLGADFPLGIASGARREEIEAVLGKAGLRQEFAFIVSAGDTPASKPAPDPYLRAAELHRVPAGSCVAIEDSRWGIASAKAAGLACVGITQTYPRAELVDADLVIDSLDEVTATVLRSLRT